MSPHLFLKRLYSLHRNNLLKKHVTLILHDEVARKFDSSDTWGQELTVPSASSFLFSIPSHFPLPSFSVLLGPHGVWPGLA